MRQDDTYNQCSFSWGVVLESIYMETVLTASHTMRQSHCTFVGPLFQTSVYRQKIDI